MGRNNSAKRARLENCRKARDVKKQGRAGGDNPAQPPPDDSPLDQDHADTPMEPSGAPKGAATELQVTVAAPTGIHTRFQPLVHPVVLPALPCITVGQQPEELSGSTDAPRDQQQEELGGQEERQEEEVEDPQQLTNDQVCAEKLGGCSQGIPSNRTPSVIYTYLLALKWLCEGSTHVRNALLLYLVAQTTQHDCS